MYSVKENLKTMASHIFTYTDGLVKYGLKKFDVQVALGRKCLDTLGLVEKANHLFLNQID